MANYYCGSFLYETETESKNMISNLNIRTFRDLFKNRGNIHIPVYQRAYSWGREQCCQFFDDLVDQNGKPYHFGLFIFEHDAAENKYFVIDGQQRLTTAVLFLSALSRIKIAKQENTDDIRKMYLSGSFSTVDDDDEYFKQLIKNGTCGEIKTETLSQGKIKEAFVFFTERLNKFCKKNGLEKTAYLQQSLENAKIGIFDTDSKDKGEASQVFEYQNNRGIRASDFEVIKAYLVHQIYIKSEDCQRDIEEIQKSISIIYRNIETISEYFSEDDILWCWFCLYEYNQVSYNDYNIDGIKWCLSPENKDKPVRDVCGWVKDFFCNFERITDVASQLIVKTSAQITNLFLIGVSTAPYWPVVIFAVLLNEKKLTNDQLCRLAKQLEILWFKYEISNRKKDSLPEWAYRYFNKSPDDNFTFDDLCKNIEEAIENGFGYWDEFKKAIPNFLGKEVEHFYFKTATHYILWQYENYLCKNTAGFLKLPNKKYHTYNTIEHIQPRSSEFSYIHNLGNLSLLTHRDNSGASDKKFEEKKQVYSGYFNEKNPDSARLILYRGIMTKNNWGKQEVTERFGKIKDFVIKYFSTGEMK